jgi:uncharacterized protein YbjT (DUF2867 family)
VSRILVTGATGFVGRALSRRLLDSLHDVVCGSRDPDAAARRFPTQTWTRFDLDDEASIEAALEGTDVAYYLVHGMAVGEDYAEREREWAIRFIDAAERAGVGRVVYLGGVEPTDEPSPHLASRLDTGLLLRRRAAKVRVLECRAAMIVGTGSESWRIVRDLASRLPAMVLPRWLENRSQPVALDDVIEALVHGATSDASGVYGLPGPDTLTGEQILRITSRLKGIRPVCVSVPFVSQRLSSHWIRWVTRADPGIAKELVQGMSSDLVCRDTPYWSRMPSYEPTSFEPAARRAIEAEEPTLPWTTRATEGLIRAVALSPTADPG